MKRKRNDYISNNNPNYNFENLPLFFPSSFLLQKRRMRKRKTEEEKYSRSLHSIFLIEEKTEKRNI